MKRFLQSAFLICIVASLSACGPKKSSDQYAGVDGDYVLGTPLPDRVDGANFFGGSVTRGQYPPIYFSFDAFSVESGEMHKVQDLAAAMSQFPNDIIIAGFTDQRGTDEYNRGLGERRAQAVRQALIDQGVDGGRIQTVSFGREMPANPANNEAAWAENRRAEVGVIR